MRMLRARSRFGWHTTTPQGSRMKKLLLAVLLLTFLPSAAHAGTYSWEKGCYSVPLVQRCWATNFDPNAGDLGSQSRTDNLNSLPTWNGTFAYGSTALNAA